MLHINCIIIILVGLICQIPKFTTFTMIHLFPLFLISRRRKEALKGVKNMLKQRADNGLVGFDT